MRWARVEDWCLVIRFIAIFGGFGCWICELPGWGRGRRTFIRCIRVLGRVRDW